MNNGSNFDRASDRNHSDHRAADRQQGQPRQTGALGKRPAPPTPVMDTKKQARHSNVVRDTVTSMMDSYFLEENNILMDDNRELERQRETLLIANQRLLRRLELAQHQLEAAHRYSALVEMWVPQVQVMFAMDFQDMREIQELQRRELEEQLGTLGEETEGEEEVEV